MLVFQPPRSSSTLPLKTHTTLDPNLRCFRPRRGHGVQSQVRSSLTHGASTMRMAPSHSTHTKATWPPGSGLKRRELSPGRKGHFKRPGVRGPAVCVCASVEFLFYGPFCLLAACCSSNRLLSLRWRTSGKALGLSGHRRSAVELASRARNEVREHKTIKKRKNSKIFKGTPTPGGFSPRRKSRYFLLTCTTYTTRHLQ